MHEVHEIMLHVLRGTYAHMLDLIDLHQDQVTAQQISCVAHRVDIARKCVQIPRYIVQQLDSHHLVTGT